MAGRGKVLFNLGMMVCVWVEVSSRPEGLSRPSSLMPADKPDSDSSRTIDTFDDTYLLADTLHFDSSRTIYKSSVIDPDSSGVIDTFPGRDTLDDQLNENISVSVDIPTNIYMRADMPDSESSIVIDASSEADTTANADPSAGTVRRNNDIRKALIEDLKKKILEGLKLADAPIDTINDTDFSNDLIHVLEQENEVTRSDQKENIIRHAGNRDHMCLRSNGTDCRRFEFNITADLDSVISVHAWFHKTRMTERLVVRSYSSMEDEPLVKLKEAPLKTTDDSSGWTIIELPKTLAFESRGEYLTCTVEIEGATVETDKDHSPFLVITKHTEIQESKKRAKRSSSEGCTCCTENFYVTLEEIGWQNWVHHPTRFNIKMCRGQCSESLSSYTINYQQIISSYYKINKNYQKPKCNFWAPRCEPDSYSPLRIVYKHKDGNLHDQEIKDLVIESCRCM